MTQDYGERIRRRAYEIWEREGHPHGRDREHWYRAERELSSEDSESERRLEEIKVHQEPSATATWVATEQEQAGSGKPLPSDLVDIFAELNHTLDEIVEAVAVNRDLPRPDTRQAQVSPPTAGNMDEGWNEHTSPKQSGPLERLRRE